MIALGHARALVTLAKACELLLSLENVSASEADVKEAAAMLEKHGPLIAEARRIVDAAAAVDVVDATPSMAWSCPTCGAKPFEACSRDGKFSKELHADRLPPGAKR